jgi:hypothetical protein
MGGSPFQVATRPRGWNWDGDGWPPGREARRDESEEVQDDMTAMAEEQPAGEGLLWVEEVAARAGVKPLTIRMYLRDARKAADAGKWHLGLLPLPVGDPVRRKVPGGHGGLVTVISPRFRSHEIDTWLANRRGPGGKLRAVNGAGQ